MHTDEEKGSQDPLDDLLSSLGGRSRRPRPADEETAAPAPGGEAPAEKPADALGDLFALPRHRDKPADESPGPLDDLLSAPRRRDRPADEEAPAQKPADDLGDLLRAPPRRRDRPAPEQPPAPAEKPADDLGDLLAMPRRRGKPVGEPTDTLEGFLPTPRRDAKPAGEPAAKGLSPLELLSLPRDQRQTINWLSRKRQAPFAEIQAALEVDPTELTETLGALEKAGYVRQALVEGHVVYRVVFGGTISRGGRGLDQEIWSVVELDNASFVQQVPLFKSLPREEVEKLVEKLEDRRYGRGEVIVWQGDAVDCLYLIKRGVVGVSRLSAQDNAPQTLASLRQGQVLGELALLVAQSSTTTITALSEVQVLLMKREDFLDLLQRYSDVAIGLARVLGQRLTETNIRIGSSEDAHLCLLFGVGAARGCTTIGHAIALTLAAVMKGKTVYSEFPVPERLPGLFDFARNVAVHQHPGGHDIFVPTSTLGLPPSVRGTLLIDQLMGNYDNIVIGLPGDVGDRAAYMLERADQVVIVASPDPDAWAQVAELIAFLKRYLRPEKSGLFTVVNRTTPEEADMPAAGRANYDLPLLETLPPLPEQRYDTLPTPLAGVTKALADSLGRTSQIGIYIPTTIGVTHKTDTTAYVERTLAFLGQLFGGATSKRGQGVWNSEEVGLVSEEIIIVQTFVTENDLDRHMAAVIEYVEEIKEELQQEAMAIEVNQKLILV
jgi:CRP-like cAMP-binding protein